MDWAEIFSFLTITWSTIVETWQCLPLAVTPSAAISSLSRERKASSTLVVLVFLPASLTINLPSITLASTSVTKIVSEVAFANLAFVIVTLRASIRQKSYKVQTVGLQDTGIGWGQRSWGGSQGSGGKVLLLANCLIPLHVVVDHLDRLCRHQISRYSAFFLKAVTYFLASDSYKRLFVQADSPDWSSPLQVQQWHSPFCRIKHCDVQPDAITPVCGTSMVWAAPIGQFSESTLLIGWTLQLTHKWGVIEDWLCRCVSYS